jgi:hypothetical protein
MKFPFTPVAEFPKHFFVPNKPAKQDDKSRRLRERISLSLPVRVQCRESLTREWSEVTRLVDVTPFGARLRLQRPIETGRLLLLIVPMPRQLRCFDHVEDQYRVWSLVRNLKLLDPKKEKGGLIEIGVAFVGKRPPSSYLKDPGARYEIAKSINEAGLWSVQEDADEMLTVLPGDKRKATRHSIPIEVQIEMIGEGGEILRSETTVTENINERGAAVFTTLDAKRGHFIRVSKPETRLLAVVRQRSVGANGITRLHLEFIGGEWPL